MTVTPEGPFLDFDLAVNNGGYGVVERSEIGITSRMPQKIGYVTLLVRDYAEAIDYFTQVLGFELVEDTRLTDDKRWVVIAPPGGRLFLFLHTDDFWRDYEDMRSRGVVFREAPRQEAYGTDAVFEDLYGNRWDLLQLGN